MGTGSPQLGTNDAQLSMSLCKMIAKLIVDNLYTVKNGVLHLHPYGCSTCHEHQAPLGVLAHTCWGVTIHSKVFENSNKECVIYTCIRMHRYIGMQQ